jgi:hypothetical protein
MRRMGQFELSWRVWTIGAARVDIFHTYYLLSIHLWVEIIVDLNTKKKSSAKKYNEFIWQP